MLNSVIELVKIASETLWDAGPVFEFGSRQVAGGGGILADMRPFFPGRKYIGVDVEAGPGVDVLYDTVTKRQREAGAILCLEVLEHAFNPQELATTMGCLLKQDGWTLVTTPFNLAIHSPPDYRRYTPLGLEQLLKGVAFEHVFILPTMPTASPITVAALAWNGTGHEVEIAKFGSLAIDWCYKWDYPLMPSSGESVMLCSHVDINARPIGWSRMSEPCIFSSNGREIKSRWLGMCQTCSMSSNGVVDLGLISRDCVYEGKQ